ncbi:SBBP repeat-containing protein, partial [Candidatus Zixiibacteriota bacterium]
NEKNQPQSLTGLVDNPQISQGLAVQTMGQMPLAFTKNAGQWDEQALFKANAGGATMWFTREGTCYQFTRRIPRPGGDPSAPQLAVGKFGHGRFNDEPDSIETIAIKATFVGANPDPEIIGESLMEYKCNYFIGNDPTNWHTDVPNYKAVFLKEVYSGIDLRYYGNGRRLEYDFVVSPGADPSRIEIQYEGALSLSVNPNGELVVATEWGEVIEQRPVVYQMQDGVRKSIAGEYLLARDNTFGFSLGKNYDPALPLVIDPVLTYSTYLGGSDGEIGYGIAVDGSGNAYITGITSSTDFPTENPYQADFGGGWDAFVTKLNISGNDLVYSTYLGGSVLEFVSDISVDDSGNAYITGYTSSTDFPTENPYQADHGGGWDDAFVTKLNSSGNTLVYSTFLGGGSP